jgi:hypothetical protein
LGALGALGGDARTVARRSVAWQSARMRVRLTGSFVLAGPVEAVLPLFTAEGERRWVPGWEPVWADESHGHEVGEVWTTAGPPATTWVTVDTGADRVRYARVAVGDSAGLVTVTCAQSGRGTTVTVVYDLSALSAAGTERLEQLAEGYQDMLAHWQHHASRALDGTGDPGGPAGPA